MELYSLEGSIIIDTQGRKYTGSNLYINSDGLVFEQDHEQYRIFTKANKIITPLGWSDDIVEDYKDFLDNYPDDPIIIEN